MPRKPTRATSRQAFTPATSRTPPVRSARYRRRPRGSGASEPASTGAVSPPSTASTPSPDASWGHRERRAEHRDPHQEQHRRRRAHEVVAGVGGVGGEVEDGEAPALHRQPEAGRARPHPVPQGHEPGADGGGGAEADLHGDDALLDRVPQQQPDPDEQDQQADARHRVAAGRELPGPPQPGRDVHGGTGGTRRCRCRCRCRGRGRRGRGRGRRRGGPVGGDGEGVPRRGADGDARAGDGPLPPPVLAGPRGAQRGRGRGRGAQRGRVRTGGGGARARRGGEDGLLVAALGGRGGSGLLPLLQLCHAPPQPVHLLRRPAHGHQQGRDQPDGERAPRPSPAQGQEGDEHPADDQQGGAGGGVHGRTVGPREGGGGFPSTAPPRPV